MFYHWVSSYLFQYEPEVAHKKVFNILNNLSKFSWGRYFLKKSFSYNPPELNKNIWGLNFSNPVGMAAGFDKNAEWINILPLLGFGFMEVGTVTPLPQEGNPQPRLFRLTKDVALLNRMGFNNKGMEVVKKNLEKRKFSSFIVGVNIGKNKITPNEKAYEDYCKCLEYLYEVGDYFVMNISSPNTPGLRDLQQKDSLKSFIEPVQNLNKKLGNKALLLKISSDLSEESLMDILEVIQFYQIDGIVATNTTIQKEHLMSYQPKMGDGGVSGLPVQQLSNELIKKIREHSKIPIIGVGGILNPEDALTKFHLGADLIQVYTGYIYYGPSLPQNICKQFLSKRKK